VDESGAVRAPAVVVLAYIGLGQRRQRQPVAASAEDFADGFAAAVVAGVVVVVAVAAAGSTAPGVSAGAAEVPF